MGSLRGLAKAAAPAPTLSPPRPRFQSSVPILPMIRFRPLSFRLQVAAVGALLPCLASSLHAQTRTTTTTRRTTTTRSLESTAQTEVARRQASAASADDNIRQGDAAMLREDYEDAVRLYRTATDSLTDSPATGARRQAALKKFIQASLKLADLRIVEARYPDAEAVAKVVLRPEYEPNNEEALELLQHLEDPEYYNQTITPKIVVKIQRVKDLLRAGNQYYDTGRFDLAFKKYEEVLALDPYNDAARRGEERVDLAKSKHAETAGYPQTRGHQIAQVNTAWELPIRRNTADIDPRRNVQKLNESSGTVAIQRKLQNIIIPNIEFRQTTLNDAVEFLRQEARRLDTGAPEEERGVNIFLKLGSSTPRSAAPVPAATDPAAIPGLPTGAETGAALPTAPTPSAVTTGTTRISLTLSRIPLFNALDYVAKAANLKIKVEPYAISIVPLTEETGDLITLEIRVPPSFIGTTNTGAGVSNALNEGASTAGGGGGGGTIDRTGAGSGPLTTRQDAKTFLESNGVTFPPGASAVYLASTSKLVVRNTQANIDLVQTLVGEVVQVPKQVEIESKFIDINQTNLKELGFDWTLGQFNLGRSSERVFAGGGTSGGSTNRTFGDVNNAFPFGNTTGAVTSGNRTGTFGISANAIDALLLGTTGGMAAAPGIFSVAGVFTDPQFQVLIRALNQQKGVDLLSAPRVTAKSGQKATIEIIREFIYPTQFQPPQIPQTVGGSVGGSVFTGGASTSAPSFPVTPTTPTAFEKRNTGVTLEVDPVIGPDNFTIDLTLQPQVVDFDGFINYGSPIQTTSTNVLGIAQTNVLTANVINQPIFSVRKVSTSVSIYDGSTVVLGGLVREDIQKVNDKVPILGDVPVVGRLFRSKIDQNIKRNLIIFVTARLIDPAGQPLLSTVEEEEETSTLTGPDTYVQPPGPMPNYYKK